MPRHRVRRETEVFSISFLDCITCGLRSVILLLVLSNIRTPAIEPSEKAEHARVLDLQDPLVDADHLPEERDGVFVGMHEADNRGPRIRIG